MKRILFIAVIGLLLTGLPGYGSENELPVIDGKISVATVNDEPITLEEFNKAIAAAHTGKHEKKTAGSIDYSAIMKRVINTRLIIIEARNMGLDELPEIKKMVKQYSQDSLMEILVLEHIRDIRPSDEEVERLYQEMTREWKITSARFEKKDAARKFEEEIKSGKDFEHTAKKAVEEGLAKEVDEGDYLKDRDLTPQIALLVSKMELGSVSPIVSVGEKGFVIFKLEGLRYPEDEDPKARKRAKERALKNKRLQAAQAYYQDLRKRYVKMNTDILESLDYESPEPGFEKLLNDKRVICEIDERGPVTVGELTKALKQKFYHGVERAIESKRINKRKKEVLERILQKRILLKEAVDQGIDKTELYTNRLKEYQNAVIFETFIKKVIIPDIRLDEKELKTYYKENREEYTFPEMMRIKSLVFGKKPDATSALEKLIKGTDFDWLCLNAEGTVKQGRQGLLKFGGDLLTVKSLPEGVRRAVSGAKSGEFRLYASPEGYFYVLYIYDVIAPKAQPFENAKKEITKKVFEIKVRDALEDYANKLRQYYPVRIFAEDLQ